MAHCDHYKQIHVYVGEITVRGEELVNDVYTDHMRWKYVNFDQVFFRAWDKMNHIFLNIDVRSDESHKDGLPENLKVIFEDEKRRIAHIFRKETKCTSDGWVSKYRNITVNIGRIYISVIKVRDKEVKALADSEDG